MRGLSAPKASTIASSSNSTDKGYLLSPTAYTLNGARRSSNQATLHTVSSRSTLGGRQQQPSPLSVLDAPSISLTAAATAYGYTPEGWHIHLEATRVSALLEACGEQIRSRGLDNPLIFSSMALDLSPISVVSLIKSFLATHPGQRTLPPAFLDEIRYANPHDLAAVIKWAFARMGRVLAVPVPVPGPKKGEVREEMVYVQQRGLLDLEIYNSWREQERKQNYAAFAFRDFLTLLQSERAELLSSLFSLLSSTASYSLKNGMMPAKLSKHFGPLLFGLPEDETFARTYDAYVRASNATEHLLLAYIRFQATTSALPPRLTQHITGYPSMLPADITLPSASSKLVPITQIERNVRLYSVDLVQSACELDLTQSCPEWDDCRHTDENLGKDPQLSDTFRKLINLRGGSLQGRRPGFGRSREASIADDDDAVAAHGSLVNKRWDDFLFDGFAAPDSSKLAFDLKESARKNHGSKRESVQWNDFSKQGFNPGNSETLADVLSFDDVLKQEVQNWPSERDHLNAKLNYTQNKLPAFNYDTTPQLLSSPSLAGVAEGKLDNHPISRMDETFADVWADYLLGSGWSNRDELTHRNANFVVVQYKSRPNASTVGSQGAGSSLAAPTRFQVSGRKDEVKDERVDAAWFVVQEVVPAQYRADLEASGRGTSKGKAMMRKLNMFVSRKDKDKAPINSVGNGNGAAVQDKIMEASGDDVFRPGSGGATKRIHLSDQLKRNGSRNASRSSLRSQARTSTDALEEMVSQDSNNLHPNGHAKFRSEGHTSGSSGGSRLISTLRAKSMRVVRSARRGASSPALNAQTDEFGELPKAAPPIAATSNIPQGGSFTSADYETRTMDVGQDGISGGGSRSQFKKRSTNGNGKDEAWLDIVLKANGNRMVGQDAPRPSTGAGVDDTAQLSVAEPMTGTRTPQSDETYHGPSSDAVPRSSTPRLADTHHDNTLPATPDTSAQSFAVPMRDASLRDATPLHPDPEPAAVPPPDPAPAPVTPLDPVAAARAALKSRKEQPATYKAAAQIDTKKLVESLRAGLSPVEAVRASKEARNSASPTNSGFGVDLSPTPTGSAVAAGAAKGSRNFKDPFAKDPIAGRVADVASRFGGKSSAAASGIPVPIKKDKPLPPVQPAAAAGERDSFNGGTAGVGAALMRSSMESRDPDEIYPEDAASNIDPREHYQSAENSSDSAAVKHLPLEQLEGETEEMEQLNGAERMGWRRSEGLEEGGTGVPTRFAQPYQPGMPLDNVLEESESVVSGTTNL